MQKLINHLNALGNGEIEPVENHLGLCDEISLSFGHRKLQVVKGYFKDWEFFSGSVAFPVPHDTMSDTDAYFFSGNLWANNEYGDSRRLLCNFLANELQKETN